MNLPNKLTVLRVIMVPFFLLFYFVPILSSHMLIAFVIFVVAAITDMLDGNIARKRGLVTNFGKLMDPLADKLLVTAAMVCVMTTGYAPVVQTQIFHNRGTTIGIIVLIIVLSRDLIVNAIRLVAASDGIVIAADKWGKFKTITQMVWLSMALLSPVLIDWLVGKLSNIQNGYSVADWMIYTAGIYGIIESVLYIAMIILTVVSGFNYVWKNRQLFADA